VQSLRHSSSLTDSAVRWLRFQAGSQNVRLHLNVCVALGYLRIPKFHFKPLNGTVFKVRKILL
jgi:hypothetical protein